MISRDCVIRVGKIVGSSELSVGMKLAMGTFCFHLSRFRVKWGEKRQLGRRLAPVTDTFHRFAHGFHTKAGRTK